MECYNGLVNHRNKIITLLIEKGLSLIYNEIKGFNYSTVTGRLIFILCVMYI